MTVTLEPTAPAVPQRRPPGWAVAILIVTAVAYVMVFLRAITSADTELLQGLTVAPIIFGLTVPIAMRIAAPERDAGFLAIILAGVAAKLVMAYVQYQIAYGYYHGRVDAADYDKVGRLLAPAYRHLDFTTNIGPLTGTGYVKVITGVVYAIVGTSRVAGFFVFAWLGFLGLLLLTRAFRIGIPSGSSRRYTIALLFFPSLLYWPAAIGKEALMLLGIGLCAYAAAALFAGRASGVLPGAGGLFLILLIRPHMALLIFAGVAFAAIIRRAPARTYAAPLFRMLGAVALIALAFFLMARTTAFLDRNLKSTSLSDQLQETEANTTDAGSAFSPAVVNTPLDIPWATVTVLFRPFPQEADNFASLLSAAEGLVLVALLALSFPRIRSVPRMVRTTPYLAFSLAYSLAFIIAFSRFANFGILARQRVQVVPFILVLIALPKLRDLVASESADASGEEAPAPVPVPPAPSRSLSATTGTRRRLRPVRNRTPVSSGADFRASAAIGRVSVRRDVYVVDLLTDDAGFRNGLLLGFVALVAVTLVAVVVQRTARTPTREAAGRPGRSGRPHPAHPLRVAALATVLAALLALHRTGYSVLLSTRLERGLALLVVLPTAAVLIGGAANGWVRLGTAVLAVPGAVVVASAAHLQNAHSWVPPFVAVTVVVGGLLLVDYDEHNARAGLAPVLLAATALATWTTVPDTEQVLVVVGVLLPLALLGWPYARAAEGAAGYGVVGLLAWVAAVGGRGRPGSVVGAVACLGILLVEPVVRRLWRGRAVLPRRPFDARSLASVAVHCVVVLGAARVAGLETSARTAASIAAIILAVGAAAMAVVLAPIGRREAAAPTPHDGSEPPTS